MEHHGINNIGKFINQKLSSLPTWVSSDEGRQIYLTNGSLWVGTDTEWVDITGGSGGESIDEKGNVTGTTTCDVSSFGTFTMTLTGATTVDFTGFVNDIYRTVIVETSNGSVGLIFSDVKWADGVIPIPTSGLDRFIFSSGDGGVTIYGGLCGSDYQ